MVRPPVGSSHANGRAPAAAAAVLVLALLAGCERSSAPAGDGSDFAALYQEHCAGCHGADGWNGPAAPLANPTYLAWVDDATLKRVTADGVPGSAMRAFARDAGGPLSDEEIDMLVREMRDRWAKPVEGSGRLPPYANAFSADVVDETQKGAAVYVGRCRRCHEPPGSVVPAVHPGAVRDLSYLALVSDQALRTAVVAGRPDLGMPDWRGDRPGSELTPAHVTQVVAFFKLFRRETLAR